MTSDAIEMAVIVLLLFWNCGLTIWAMYLIGERDQYRGYIKRLERDGYRVLKTRGDL